MYQHNSVRGLPAPAEERAGRHLMIPVEAGGMPHYSLEAETAEMRVPFSHYVWILKRHRWKILAFVATCVVATAIVSNRITPVYESTATVDIDRQMPAGIIGQEAMRSGTNDADQFLATQVKLIQSDAVLRPVAEQYRLLDTDRQGTTAADDAPVLLRGLRVNRPPNTYLLLISYRSTDPHLAADVSNAVAHSYLERTYDIRYRSSASLSAFMEKQLEGLKAKMESSSEALARFERELNVINPEEKTSILSARLLQLNSEYTNAQTARVRKEAAYKSVQSGSLEAALASPQGESLKKLTEQLDDAQQKLAEIRTHYGVNHPEYKKATAHVTELQRQLDKTREGITQRLAVTYSEAVNQESMLKKAVAETKAEFDRLNAHSFEYQAVKREAEADKKLYEELVRKIKEAGINAGFQNSAIRIADQARPGAAPVFPNVKLNVLLSFLLASLLAVATAVFGDVLNHTVRDPEHIATSLRTTVVGSLPAVKEIHDKLIAAPSENLGLIPFAKAERNFSGYDEAIRTLRNSILLTDFDRRLRTLMITSPCPSEGKSTVAVNLAVAHAQQGHRTLLIDGDLRRPSVHRRLELDSKIGFSNVLTGDLPWEEALIHRKDLPHLDILAAGPPSRRAADLIGTRLGELLEQASKRYDLVVLDSPPLLGFPEPLEMAASADGVLMVAMAGKTDRKALGSALATLSRLRANVLGVVLNKIRSDSGNGYYHYYHPKYYRNYRDQGAGA